jgi:hypothetical protein
VIKQRLATDCGICSLAMLAGITYEEAIAIAGNDFDPLQGMSFFSGSLKRLGLSSQYEKGVAVGDFVNLHRGILSPSFFRQLAWGRKALVSLPSLNYPEKHHMIYYDGRDVFDPSPLKTYDKFSDLLPDELIVVR